MTSGNFSFSETKIHGVYVVDVKVYRDNRGSFFETYRETDFKSVGLNYSFVQDNFSMSYKGVLRGLHYQKQHPQAKLVRVISGEVFDVAVDLRNGSTTYGHWVGAFLSGENHRQLLIPRGFAHGFLVLSNYSEFAYKCDDYYYPEDEGGIIWNDPDIAVKWPQLDSIILSEKDTKHPRLKDIEIMYDL